jgi:cytochrome P450
MFSAYRRDPLALYAQLAHTYGDVVRVRFLWVNTYAVNHPDYIKYVLQEHHRNYRRDSYVTNVLQVALGHNLFTAEGDSWLSRRRLMQPAFHRQQLASFGTLMTDAAEAMLAQWDIHPTDIPLDIDQEMMQVTLRIAGQAFFGVDLLGAAHDLGAAFTAYSEFVNYRFKTPFPLPLWWPTRMHRHFKAAITLVDQTVQMEKCV